ncbi:MAG: ABC transporter substrate-binding protein [Candidatus Poribacteria bacterium]|nr:ABC transporter substrate-binding protein [Candidatus Poribacteria bacterium]
MLRKIVMILIMVFSSVIMGCERMQVPLIPVKGTLKVGVLQPPSYYPSYTKGVELAQAEINQSGGILGMDVALVQRDERTDTFAETLTEFVEVEKVVGLIGPVFSSHAVRIAPDLQLPILAGATDANRVTQTNDFIFLVGGSNALHAQHIAQFAVSQLRSQTAAMVWQADDVYSMGLVDAFDVRFQELSGDIVGRHTYQVGATTFTEQLTSIHALQPDVVFLASFPPEVPLFIEAARDMGIESVFIGGDGMEDPENMLGTLTDNTPLEGTYYTTNLDLTSDNPNIRQFTDAYQSEYGETPDGVAASGYDALHLLKVAIEAAGTTEPVAVRDALAKVTNYSGATYIANFDVNRHPVKGVGIMKIENGMIAPHTFVSQDAPNASE